ncbi:hypothetical protein [Gryllotalpicola koreensis]|uniref:Uncharacterized protein n=1 Tax=Gryllotalpicola koreensis TaxID=993086 RepID=A0ABP8A4I6_9MICO
MTETSTRSGGLRRGVRRAGALTAAAGLLLVGVLMAGPAVAAAAEPVTPVAISETIEPELGPVTDDTIMPISEEAAIEPISEVVETLTRPLGLSIFLASALTLGAGGIAIARVAGQRKQQAARVESRK